MKRIILSAGLAIVYLFTYSQIKVACIGNSITAGGYPEQLQHELGNEWLTKNFGVSGSTMLRNGDHPYYKTKAYTDAKEFNPDVVIIKLGTNDSKPQNWKYADEFYKDYATMIDELKALPSKPFIIICYPVPAYSKGWNINDTVIRNEMIPKIKVLAHDKNVKLVDLYIALSEHAAWFPDGIHPNKEGSQAIAGTLAKKLKEWKKKIERKKGANENEVVEDILRSVN